MYTTKNFKTKKELALTVREWLQWDAILKAHHGCVKTALVEADWLQPREPVTLYAPGLGEPKRDGFETVEGPHYPEPHRWYATVTVKDGIVIAVK